MTEEEMIDQINDITDERDDAIRERNAMELERDNALEDLGEITEKYEALGRAVGDAYRLAP